jgi:hypothetical protein
MNQPPPPHTEAPAPLDDESTGLPLLREWRGVYWTVSAIFLLYVVLLTTLMKVYS